MNAAMNIWQRKLLAFLHDPPHKALDIPGHEQARETFIRQAGFSSAADIHWFDKESDHLAAEADRFPFPTYAASGLKSDFDGVTRPFRHPLGGSALAFDKAFASPAELAEILQAIQHYAQNLDQLPADKRDWASFFLHWRRWPVDSAQKDGRAAFMPADTRIPDHPIWHHNSVVSALQGCVNEATGKVEAAFLLFQLGPVQEFIAQARSTRDLWSGSYLISWLMAHAIKAVTDQVGPDHVIYPFLRAQPLFDLLHRDELYLKVPYTGPSGREDTLWSRLKRHEREMLIPNLPNRFLAILPAGKAVELAKAAEQAIAKELARVADATWQWLNARHPLDPAWRKRFDAQVAAFPQVTWQVFPSGDDLSKELGDYKAMVPEAAADLEKIRAQAASPNIGMAWPVFYAKVDRLLAARRNTRDTKPWKTDENQAGAVKDSLSGKEEVIGSEDWWEGVRIHPELKFLFRSADRLGAVNLVKRVWHKAYLAAQWKLDVKKAVSFESVPGIAAAEWMAGLSEKVRAGLREKPETFDRLVDACRAIRNHAEKWNIETPGEVTEKNADQWMLQVDPEAFMPATWTRKGESEKAVLSALARLYDEKSTGIAGPPGYVAILALDGDEMGRWVSGEKTPELLQQFSEEAREFFKEKLGGVRRPLSPSYHLQFSEALANFALYLVRPVVEAFHGQLIYAGGDDVLAMVPAARALDCAEALRAAFKGAPRLAEFPELAGTFEVKGSRGGFVRLKDPKAEQPSWPLIVPGPEAEVSVGIAIGHAGSPLQSLIRAAQAAEKAAKTRYGRAAFAVALFKRSGEILEWGAKWEAGALLLYRMFVELSAGDLLSNRFAYALSDLLAPYRPASKAIEDVAGFPVRAVLERELARVVERQGKKLRDRKAAFVSACKAYLDALENKEIGNRSDHLLEDFPMLFHVANFVTRGERR